MILETEEELEGGNRKGMSVGWFSSTGFEEMWYDTVKMVSETKVNGLEEVYSPKLLEPTCPR